MKQSDYEILFSLQEMDLNVELTTVKDFDIRPSKKAKCSESNFTISSMVSESINSESENELNEDQFPSTPSPTKSTLSPVFSELINEETVPTYEDKLPGEPVSVPTYEDKLPGEPVSTDDNKLPDEPTSTPSPTKSASPVSELMNEETLSEDEDKQIFSEHDNKLPDEPNHIINNLTYDYLPQGIHLLFCTFKCIIYVYCVIIQHIQHILALFYFFITFL
jgi:hypothetical protein